MTLDAGDLLQTIADEASAESSLWQAALRSPGEWELQAVFSPLGADRFALSVETIYEGYLLHYGRPRLFAPADADTAVLLGDYLFAHGLVRIAAVGGVGAVSDLSELISLCTQLRAERARSALDGAVWVATAALLGETSTGLDRARTILRLEGDSEPLLQLARHAVGGERVAYALAAHGGRVE